ncbi:alpha/beta fold hydrolase [Microbacterium neungamense]|uniref:alpha/beta fold hydrolase n=1 Tax=Microbacterium neungamense TaxID=2810535 RepID=UPI00217CEE6F|nr:alpha/beta hydrolase [Microbacterium neungamense]UWF77564.1 alpha/beta fold hydrolase [Microbacterium neungamense]
MDGERRGEPEGRARFRTLRRAAFASRGFPAAERLITDAPGRRTAVLDHGTGPAVLLIHGGVGVTAEWAPIAGRLSGRVLVADRPGFGLSDPRDVRVRGFRRASAEWVATLLDALELDRVDLVAGSMGGFVATAFATAHPDRVRRLVLGDQDRLLPPSAAQALARRMPDAEVTVVADAGHIPHLDHPEAVAAAIAEARR